MEISHEEFVTIMKKKDKYEKIKEDLTNPSEKPKNTRLNSGNSQQK